ncbi:MAG: alcohol dehydrogenase catalytic domain-containing protein [Oscillospiraceae bacterium]|nr:alcohol dehydrogenase catalytic domain-containing protein [Oscillospiraceae bacterium]
MKAVQITDVKKVELIDLPEPELKPGYAKIDVKALGICGSDVHAFAGHSPNVTYPVVIGHEIAGVVTEIAPGAENPNGIQVGDRVVLNPYVYCGECYPCSKGQTNCCDHLKVLGVQTGGSMSERFAHPVKLMVKVPDAIDWETAAVIEPSVIALHGLNVAKVQPGEHVVVVGAGCIGMLVGLLAKAKGAVPIMVDIVDERLELAKSFGLPYVVNSMTQDAEAYIRQITNGLMAECVSEVSGSVQGVRNALNYVASTGRIVMSGWPNSEVPLLTAAITRHELQVLGARNGVQSEFEEVIDLVTSGKVDIHQIISKVVTLEELPREVEDLDAHPGDNLKVIALNHCC